MPDLSAMSPEELAARAKKLRENKRDKAASKLTPKGARRRRISPHGSWKVDVTLPAEYMPHIRTMETLEPGGRPALFRRAVKELLEREGYL